MSPISGTDPEYEALLAESVSLALLVVLDTLAPAERLAFVLHDMFALPFDEIAPVVDRTPAATRQLASRARRRVQGAAGGAEEDPQRQRQVIGAVVAAVREGDFGALLELLDPDVVLRADGGEARPGLTKLVRGAQAVAEQAALWAGFVGAIHPVLINGDAGFVATMNGEPFSLMAVLVRNGRVAEIDILADPARLERLVRPVVTKLPTRK